MTSRWATFDCYGTLVDWNGGVGTQLSRLFGDQARDHLLARYHVIEPRVQSDHPEWTYRAVMAAVLAELASEAGTTLSGDDKDALGRSLPSWPVAEASRHVHVAQSHFHDIVPAHELGIRSIWINRTAQRAEPKPTRELHDLTGLAVVLDELVPPG